MKTSPSDANADGGNGFDYERLFRDLPEPYVLFEASDPEYRIVDANKAREQLTGQSNSECIGRSLFDVYPYNDSRFMTTVGKGLRGRLQQCIRTGRSQELEPFGQTILNANGGKETVYLQAAYFPLRDASGRVRCILGHAREVTGERHAMEKVVAAENRLAAALTIGRVGSWVFDTATERIIGDENFRKLFNMTQRRPREFSLDSLLRAVHEEDRERIRAAVERSVTKRVAFEEEYRVILRDGTQRWVLARGRPENHEGRLVFPGVVVDISEQRDLRAQVELARHQDKLNQQAARILQHRNEELEAVSRTKDEFVALASHQLRTPATAVKQYIGMMLQGYVGDINDEQTDVLAKAFESNERQMQIINQILSAARADTGRLVMVSMPVDIGPLLRGIIADMKTMFDQRQQNISVYLPRRPVQVAADLGYLRMAVENVLHNANIYTPVGGKVSVRLTQTAGRCVLSITDTGVGIKKSDLGKLFMKFSRIHNPLSVEAGGSGIGLYLTAEIVRLHGGEITVDSHVGKGSTFTIRLPLTGSASGKRGD